VPQMSLPLDTHTHTHTHTHRERDTRTHTNTHYTPGTLALRIELCLTRLLISQKPAKGFSSLSFSLPSLLSLYISFLLSSLSSLFPLPLPLPLSPSLSLSPLSLFFP